MRFSSCSRLLVAVALASLSFVAASSARADAKIAVIDMQKAILDTNEGARALDSFKKTMDKKQKDLEDAQTKILKDKGDLEKKCKSGPREACEKGMDDLQKRYADWQKAGQDFQVEVQKKQQEATQPILTKLVAIVKRIAQKEGYDVVVDKLVAHYQRADLDVTDTAIKMFNAESTATPLPPAGTPEKKPAGPAPKAPAGKK
jgi:outer membrane protein